MLKCMMPDKHRYHNTCINNYNNNTQLPCFACYNHNLTNLSKQSLQSENQKYKNQNYLINVNNNDNDSDSDSDNINKYDKIKYEQNKQNNQKSNSAQSD